jgi:hypothetical protein
MQTTSPTAQKPTREGVVHGFDSLCRLSRYSNRELGQQLATVANRERVIAGETVRQWRHGETMIPGWAVIALCQLLTQREWKLEQVLRFFFPEPVTES